MSQVRKALIAAAGAGAAALVAAWPGGVTPEEYGVIAGAIVTVGLATWRVPNEPGPRA